jgi:hypothetical protein
VQISESRSRDPVHLRRSSALNPADSHAP